MTSPLILPAALVTLVLALIPVSMFNAPLFTLINRQHSPVTDLLWLAFTTLGDGLLLGIILGAFVLVNPRVTVVGLLVLILSSFVLHLIKAAYPTLRPVELLQSVHVVGPLLRSGSFPSGHAAAGMSAGLAVAYFCRSRVMGAFSIAIAVLIGLSRIFVGAHFPADVLGGMICALTVFFLLTLTAWPALERHVPERPSLSTLRFRVALSVEVLATLFALFVYAPFSAELPPFAALIAVAVLIFVAARYWRMSSRQNLNGTSYP
jgi:undecaprenyl-diphosphatase